jgi:CubicO group peptidase (beta-lactamase class C family)
VAKSFVSALVGIAIQEGYIESVEDPITKYIPELKGPGMDEITIRDLLTMSSVLKYSGEGSGGGPFNDDAKTYGRHLPFAEDLATARNGGGRVLEPRQRGEQIREDGE